MIGTTIKRAENKIRKTITGIEKIYFDSLKWLIHTTLNDTISSIQNLFHTVCLESLLECAHGPPLWAELETMRYGFGFSITAEIIYQKSQYLF